METKNNCCESHVKKKDANGLWEGIVYAITPHSFCILFVVFSAIGSAAGMAFAKDFLANRNAFLIIFIISILFAVLSALLYLKRKNSISIEGVKNNWKYLSILFGTIIAVNFFLFFYIFPATANMNSGNASGESLSNLSSLEMKVDIPCPGHAPLITNELRKVLGVSFVSYKNPDLFKVYYDQAVVSEQDIFSLDIFDNFKAEILWSQKK